MNLIKAISLSIGDLDEPVITAYRLGLVIHNLYTTKSFRGESLSSLEKDYATSVQYNTVTKELKESGIIEPHPNFPNKAYRLLGRKETDVKEVACTIDPFCYVSHLSAMSHHGLTNRLPIKLFISSPDQKHWREEARKQMEKDLGEAFYLYSERKLPQLTQIRFDRIDRTEIHRYNSIHWGAYKNVAGKAMRVSTIGRTFLDMLRNPNLCGGIHHIIEVYEDYAETYLPSIVAEVDVHGGSIDKVRAGYILEEKLGIKDDTVESWVKHAKRGGSRKLDPSEEYMPTWSEKWCLSLNI